jgi:hypothetical protein
MDKLIDYEGLGTFQTNLLNDNKVSPIATWSSEKITDELANKLSAYATTSAMTTALAGLLNDNKVSPIATWSSEKISDELNDKANTSDLSAYATTSAMTTALAGKQNTLTAGSNVSITGNTISAIGYSYSDYLHSFSIGVKGLTSTNTASGSHAFAEGWGTTASAQASHTEGWSTTANGEASHAEGSYTTASGYASHAEGYLNVTHNKGEHAEGYYNISHTYDANATDTNSFDKITIHSIGVGYEWNDGRDWVKQHQNGIEIMRNGDMYLYGVGNYDGVHIKNEQGAPANLQTLQEVISSLTSTIASLEARIAALENPTTVE